MNSKSGKAALPHLLGGAAFLYRTTLFWVGAAGMATMMMVIIAQIFCRYLLGFSLIWSEELCRAILVWITFLYAGLALDAGEIIAVDFLEEALPRRVALAPVAIGSLVSLGTVSILVYYGYRYASFNAGQVTAALQISQFWIYLSVPVGLGLFAVHLTLRTLSRLSDLWAGKAAGVPLL